jgi:hypothetical protein
MRKKCCCEEEVFAFVWNNADEDGLWSGDAAVIAAEFGVTEDESYSSLSDLTDRGLIEQLYPGNFAIVRWREGNDPGEEEVTY